MKFLLVLLTISLIIVSIKTEDINWSDLGNCWPLENDEKSGICDGTFHANNVRANNIESLEIRNARFAPFHWLFAGLSSLKHLTIIDCPIPYLTKMLFGLSNLETFKCINCGIETLADDALKDLKNLKTFHLIGHSFESVPDDFFTYTKELRSLNISDNSFLKYICGAVQKLEHLEEFEMRESFYTFYAGFQRPWCLKTEHIQRFNMKLSATHLDGSYTFFNNSWPKLEYLNVAYAYVRDLYWLRFHTKTNLRYLNARGNMVKYITDELNQLTHLEELDLSLNFLKEVFINPFKNLANLKTLWIGENPIFQMNFLKIMQTLKNLQHFDIRQILCTTAQFTVLDTAATHFGLNYIDKQMNVKCPSNEHKQCDLVYLVNESDNRRLLISESETITTSVFEPWWTEKIEGVQCYDDCGSRLGAIEGRYNIIQQFSTKTTMYHFDKLEHQIEKFLAKCQDTKQVKRIRNAFENLAAYVNVTAKYVWGNN